MLSLPALRWTTVTANGPPPSLWGGSCCLVPPDAGSKGSVGEGEVGVIIWGGCRKRKVLPVGGGEEQDEDEDEEEDAEEEGGDDEVDEVDEVDEEAEEAGEGGMRMNASGTEMEIEWLTDPLLMQIELPAAEDAKAVRSATTPTVLMPPEP